MRKLHIITATLALALSGCSGTVQQPPLRSEACQVTVTGAGDGKKHSATVIIHSEVRTLDAGCTWD